MAVHEVTLPPPMRNDVLARVFRVVFFAFWTVQAGLFLGMLVHVYLQWFANPVGHGAYMDFLNVWTAGGLVVEGRPAAAYDWEIHKQAQEAAIGRKFQSYFGWHYPPPFLAVAAVLSLLPFAAAYALWMSVTLLLYVATARSIIGDRVAYLLAGAFPAAVPNMILGQNGFLSATLVGGTLVLMERRPILAGCCLGLLTYKPHFGILFPIVLAVTSRWTVFFAAAAMGITITFVSWLLFGTATWEAFVHWLPVTSRVVLSEGQANWAKLHSIYGLTRIAGGSDTLGWSLTIAALLLVASALCIVWRSKCAFDLKAAALATAILLVTPYVYIYDMMILAIGVAFFFRHATVMGIGPVEYFALTVMTALIVCFYFVTLPFGVAATGILAMLIVRRCFDLVLRNSARSLPAT